MRIKVTLRVDYDESSVEGDDIIMELEREVTRAIETGMLTGATAAVVDNYDLDIEEVEVR